MGGLREKVSGLTITKEIREVSDSKKRLVKVIRCTRGPGINEYADFVKYDPSLSTCPLPVRKLSTQGTGNNELQLPKEDHINNKIINNNDPVQKKARSEKEGGQVEQKDSSLYLLESGQETIQKQTEPIKDRKSEKESALSCLETGKGWTRRDKMDKGEAI